MWQRVRVFGFAFSGYFERMVRQEIASRDLEAECRRPGVLVARGLLFPTISAVCRAGRLALGVECARAQSAQKLFRANRDGFATTVRARRPKIPASGHARPAKQGIAA